MANIAFVNSESSSGICTGTAPAGPGCCWNLTSISVSQQGAVSGTSAKVTVWDGAVGTTRLWSAYLNGPGTVGTGIGSVGTIQDMPLPRDPQGRIGLQGTPGNAMNVQVTGTGSNAVILNCRFSDGLP